MQKQIVRSIDLGYGHVKYTTRNNTSNEPEVVTRQIPALALPVFSQNMNIEGSGIKQPETVSVEVNSALYQVGPDTPLLLAGQSGRDLNGDYSRSDRYLALMLGTLAYMNEHKLDLLVLGLPVSRFTQERERLKGLFSGGVKVPVLSERDRTTRIEIKNVVILPQPMGGFLDARANSPFGDEGRGNTLVIDPGFYTFDWVMVTDKKTFISSRSSAVNGGVSSILRLIADQIQQELGQQINDLFPIDRSLKSGEPLIMYGKTIELSKYKPLIDSKCKTYVSDMLARLGDIGDIRRVVLCGGGAKMFKDSVKNAFKDWEIHVATEPIFSNVRGFQLFGEQYARRMISATA